MPELPEAETIVRYLRPRLQGRTIKEIRFSKKARDLLLTPAKVLRQTLPGKTMARLERRGKKIVLFLDSGEVLAIGLGMSGALLSKPLHQNKNAHLHFSLFFDGDWALYYYDARRFGDIRVLAPCSENKLRRQLNMAKDPFELSGPQLAEMLAASQRPIKNLLLDQTKISGLGNIYGDEALFAAKIHPRRASKKLAKDADALLESIKIVLQKAIACYGSSVADYVMPDGQKGNFQNHHAVYDREGEPCINCGSRIKRLLLAGRSAHFCPRCQKF